MKFVNGWQQASLFPAFWGKMPEIPEIRSQKVPDLKIAFQHPFEPSIKTKRLSE